MAAGSKGYEGRTNGVLRQLSRERRSSRMKESRNAPRRRWQTFHEVGPPMSGEGQQHLKRNHQNCNLFIEYVPCVGYHAKSSINRSLIYSSPTL